MAEAKVSGYGRVSCLSANYEALSGYLRLLKMKKPKAKTRISVYVNATLKEWLRVYAFKTRQSQGAVVRQALEKLSEQSSGLL